MIQGRFELTVAGEVTTIGPCDTYYVSSGIEHGVVALKDSILLDVFTPQREDFVAQININDPYRQYLLFKVKLPSRATYCASPALGLRVDCAFH